MIDNISINNSTLDKSEIFCFSINISIIIPIEAKSNIVIGNNIYMPNMRRKESGIIKISEKSVSPLLIHKHRSTGIFFLERKNIFAFFAAHVIPTRHKPENAYLSYLT
ncbi:MAG: hypothetical protein ACI83O_000111 [Patescibacteria group bacterium]|jgi:hypothetical protein